LGQAFLQKRALMPSRVRFACIRSDSDAGQCRQVTAALADGSLAVILCRTDSPAVSRSFRDLTDGVALAIASAGVCGVCGVSRSPMAGSRPARPPAWRASTAEMAAEPQMAYAFP
jgi:hypothetical protein